MRDPEKKQRLDFHKHQRTNRLKLSEDNNSRTKKKDFNIVGVGASAGGLEAFKSLLQHLPEDTGMAFVLVQHLDPTHPSSLPHLLEAATKMSVIEARNGISVTPNCIYVIPSNAVITLKDYVIQITKRGRIISYLPIDALFNSLAENHPAEAIGVVLSGTGSDGAAGLMAIKSVGGITFAQDEVTAKYTGMPQSAEKSGSVDFVLPPHKIAASLAKIGKQRRRLPSTNMTTTLDTNDHFKEVQKILHDVTGVDFTNYKVATIERRVQRRLLLNKVATLKEYLNLLRRNRLEVESLYNDIFIHVTNFFREPKKYEVLRKRILPRILKKTASGESLRIWVPGCSSGEEVFSLAIVILEALDELGTRHDLRIFATDISESEIKKARAGVYPISIKNKVSAQRLKNFFTKGENSYQIVKMIREICVFAKHDLIEAPPFSQMDLISCNNVLIYLAEPAQKRVLTTFHYSLKRSGFLLLGKAESTNSVPQLFQTVDKTHRIYSKRVVGPRLRVPFITSHQTKTSWEPSNKEKTSPTIDWEREADRYVLDKYNHSGFLVDSNMNILAFRGAVTPFLEPSRGEASLELTKMVRKDLRMDLRMLHQSVKRKMAPSRKERIAVRIDGHTKSISIEEVPLQDSSSSQSVFLIMLEDKGADKNVQPAFRKEKISNAKNRLVSQLQQQLAEMKEDMRTNMEELGQLNEQMTSANEELQSANEELQSTNEEYESTKEQLESSNEELVTLNEELQTRNLELDQTVIEVKETRDFARAVIETVREPLIILDQNLRVQNANPAFYEKFQLSSEKVQGIYFLDIDEKSWAVPDLRKKLEEAFQSEMELIKFSIEHDFPKIGRRILLLNARKIEQGKTRDQFILLAIEDITDTKRLEEASSTLMKDIHHRVKNNLQVITSLLSLQSRFLHNSDSAVEAFKESANRVRSMALIHEKLYESERAGKMHFNEYITDLANVLFTFYNANPKVIQLRLEVEDIYLEMDQAIPCGLIINELLSNSLKHAFPEGNKGKISVSLKRVKARKKKKPTSIIFSVNDNGRGLPASIAPDRADKLGLKIVSSLVKQLDGSLKVDRHRGTGFQVTFPEKYAPFRVKG